MCERHNYDLAHYPPIELMGHNSLAIALYFAIVLKQRIEVSIGSYAAIFTQHCHWN